ncbi:cupin domain-containing protein [Kitasatospora sp. NPDC127067]|uniref:cupin domain-containing protein n=1 Tax=Kitasatospora sp. NPDC127067 TaxID=3347126 RepID=UPI00364F06A3
MTGSNSTGSTLEALIGIDLQEFLQIVAGGHYKVARAANPSGLISLAEFDELISGPSAFSGSDMRLIKDGTPLAGDRYTVAGSSAQIDGAKVIAAISHGYTLVANRLHQVNRKCGSFARKLAEELHCPVAINAYLTPAGSQGLSPHYDHHDVFVIQIEGSKVWNISPPVIPAPTMRESWRYLSDSQAAEIESQAVNPTAITLSAGDVLYLPRGWMHSASAQEGHSFHLTISVDPVTRKDVLIHVMDILAAQDDWFRRESSLFRMGSDQEILDEISTALTKVVDGASEISAPSLVEVVQESAANGLGIDGPKMAVTALGIATPSNISSVRRRAGLRWSTTSLDDERVAVQVPGAKLVLPQAALPSVTLLLSGREVTRREAAEALGDEAVADQLIAAFLQAGALEPMNT